MAANTSTNNWTGTVTIAGMTYTVTQFGSPYTHSLSVTRAPLPWSGDDDGAIVSSATGCSWMVASNVAWFTLNGGATGSGDGPAGYTVTANTGATARTGTLTIAGTTYAVTQTAVACSYTL